MFIDPIPRADAVGRIAQLYEEEEARAGYLPMLVEVLSHRPDTYDAFRQLIGSVRRHMDPRRGELATLAAALSMRATACSVAHGKVLRDRFYEPDRVVQIATDHHQADLDAADVAVMDFAMRAATDPNQITQAEVDHLRSLGLSDPDVLDVVLMVATRAFVAILVESLGAPPEKELVDTLEPGLVEVLAVGRPLPGR